jgi:hypothetical protein
MAHCQVPASWSGTLSGGSTGIQAKVIVEYGAGTGNFTKAILEHMRPDARLIALEINPEFYQFLSTSFNDPRLHISQESAADIDTILTDLGYSRAELCYFWHSFHIASSWIAGFNCQKDACSAQAAGKVPGLPVLGDSAPYLERVFGHVSGTSNS